MMSMQQTLFSVALLAIMAAAGLAKDIDIAWQMAAVTAALAFFSIELAAAAGRATRLIDQYRRGNLIRAANVLVILSWVTGATGGVSLIIYS